MLKTRTISALIGDDKRDQNVESSCAAEIAATCDTAFGYRNSFGFRNGRAQQSGAGNTVFQQGWEARSHDANEGNWNEKLGSLLKCIFA